MLNLKRIYVTKKLIFTAFVLITLFSITFSIFKQNFFENILYDVKLDKYDHVANLSKIKPRNEVWEQMNHWIFFKRTSCYYIIEKSLLKAYFISKDTYNGSIDIILQIQYLDNSYSHAFVTNNVDYQEKESRSNYRLNLLTFEFNLLETFSLADYKMISNMFVNFRDGNNSNYSTQYPLKATIKRLQTQVKSGSIVCSKCFYFQNRNDHKFLRWWIELNKQIGYSKIVFCNQSIPNTKEFNQIFDAYKDFIDLKQFHFIPNFNNLNERHISPYEHDYLTDYFQLSPSQRKYDWNVDGYDVLHTNECFLENADKYEYVTVVDNDETIIPRINTRLRKKIDTFNFIKNITPNSLESDVNSINLACESDAKTSYIEDYLKTFGSMKNYHFGMAYYLKNVDVKRIFNAFEAYFNGSTFNPNSTYHVIQVFDTIAENPNHNPYTYNFVISNKDELSYARNLLFLYKNFIEKFENKYQTVLDDYSEQYHRYFYISGAATDWLCGKSIWHTDKTSEYSVHYGVVADYLHTLDFDNGHNGHFRRNYPFKAEQIKITDISLDFNYLNCFYKPIIEKFTNINILQ
jgi:hypothetical protein